MRPNAMCAGRIGKVLVGGLVTVAAVAGSGCGVRPSDPETAFWDQYIRVMDAARLRGDFYAAEAARQNAYLAALGSRRWDAMAAVGDASARLGEEFPALEAEVRRLTSLYARAVYDYGDLPANTLDVVRQFWKRLETTAEQPI